MGIETAIIGSALIGGAAANKASKTQAGAVKSSNKLQQAQYEQTRADNEPWRVAGQNALEKLTGLMNSGALSTRFTMQDFTNEPGYQFALQEGTRAVNNSASARGGIGGAALKAGARFAEDNANKFYGDAFNRWNTENNNYFNRLSGIAGTGQQVNSANSSAGMNYANNVGNNINSLGDATAKSQLEQGNIYGNALGQLGAWYSRPSGGVTNGQLAMANMSDDPIYSLARQNNWFTGP